MATGLARRRGPLGTTRLPWLARGFASPIDALVTLVVAAIVLAIGVALFRWAVLDATWRGSAAECRASLAGACWAFVAHKLRFILFGLYPPSEQWRPAIATSGLLVLIGVTGHPRFWRRELVVVWVIGLIVAFVLMR